MYPIHRKDILKKLITLSDIAKEAGVSVATVSAVLNNKTGCGIRVSESRKEYIIGCAKRLGYVPNIGARNLKKGRSNIIAVFTYENIFPIESVNEFYSFFVGIQEEAERLGYDIIILNNWKNDDNRMDRISISDGAIMIGPSKDINHISALIHQGFPIVSLGYRDIGADVSLDCVFFGYKEAIINIVNLICPFVRLNVVYVTSKIYMTGEHDIEKRKSFFEACHNKGISVVEVIKEEKKAGLDAILENKVVVFHSIGFAYEYTELFDELGLVIGKDIFGACLEDDWIGRNNLWTNWNNSRMSLGARSVRKMNSIILDTTWEEGDEEHLQVVARASTGK